MIVSQLENILKTRGLSRRQLARDCGLTANAVGNMCRTHHSSTPIVHLKTLDRICVALDIPLGDLLKQEEG